MLSLGLSSVPRVFTKLLKPIFSQMRQEGHTVLGYIDDCLIIAKSYQECSFATLRLRNLLLSLGFSINEKKSLCVPDQQIVFLGYEIDSRKMTIAPTPQKREKSLKVTDKLLQGKKFKIRFVASAIGFIVDIKGQNMGQIISEH